MTILAYHKAKLEHVDQIVSLVNAAYRGESSKRGWTTEADLLDGQRTDAKQVGPLITDEQSFILLCHQNNAIIGTALLKKLDDGAYLGMLTIKPSLQGRGIGKLFLSACEQQAWVEWGSRKITMSVITLRHELIAFYERRGYHHTGVFGEFPKDPSFGLPKVSELKFEYLEKFLDVER